jgi:hypothetical protein
LNTTQIDSRQRANDRLLASIDRRLEAEELALNGARTSLKNIL